MIFLLKKIRKQLLSDNKNATYMIYAFGEFLLVVVGILFALTIDNWNDQRKEKIRELTYLEAVKNDLELNQKEVELIIKKKLSVIESSNILIKYFENDTIHNASYFNLHHINASITQRFEEKNNTFKELENSGQLSLISNKEIKNVLLDMDLIYRRIEFQEVHLYNDLRDLNYSFQFHKVDLNPTVKNYAYQLSNGKQGENVEGCTTNIRKLLI